MTAGRHHDRIVWKNLAVLQELAVKTAFLTAQMLGNFGEWAAAWPVGPNTLGILFQLSAALGSAVYPLLCFKK